MVGELLHGGVAFPEDPITERRYTLLLARIVLGGPEVILVGWQESDVSLLEVLEEQLLVLELWVLGCRVVESIKSKNQVVLVEQLTDLALLKLLEDLRPVQGVDAEVQITKQDSLLVVFDSHATVAEVILECCPKYLPQLFRALLVFSASAHKMAVDDHDGLVTQLESEAHSALVACSTESPDLDFASLERLWLESTGQLALQEYGEVAPDHGLVGVDELLLQEILFRLPLVLVVGNLLRVHSIERLGEQRPPELNALVVFDEAILGIELHYLLQGDYIDIRDKALLDARRVAHLKDREQLLK